MSIFFPKESIEKIKEIQSLLPLLDVEWSDLVEEKIRLKEERKKDTLFSDLRYLVFCEYFKKTSSTFLIVLDNHQEDIFELKEKLQSHVECSIILENIKHMKECIHQTCKKTEGESSLLAEKCLKLSLDLIADRSKYLGEAITEFEKQVNLRSMDGIFLRELSTILVNYRQSRLDLTDLPKGDAILLQLDTAISACDLVLLLQDVTD